MSDTMTIILIAVLLLSLAGVPPPLRINIARIG